MVISIIALLLSILMPSLASAKEIAKKLICSSNLHSIGLGLQTYQQEQNRIPPQYDRWGPHRQTYDNSYLEPWVTYTAYHQDETDASGRLMPLQLAYIFEAGNLDTAQVLYCTSQSPRSDHLPFTYNFYTADGSRKYGSFLPIKTNGSPDDKIRTAYHYWAHGRSSLNNLANKPVVFDNIQHWNSVAHTKNNRPHGVNALFGDGHVNFSNNDALFELALWNGGPEAGPWDGPGNDRTLFIQIIDRLQP